MTTPRAVIAEDEPVLRAELRQGLATLWPELEVCAEVPDGIAALRAIEDHAPDVLFLDIEMPGMNGLEVARLASGTLPRRLRHGVRPLCGGRLRAAGRRLHTEAAFGCATRVRG